MFVDTEGFRFLKEGNLREAKKLFLEDAKSENEYLVHDAYEGLALIESEKIKKSYLFKSRHSQKHILYLKKAIEFNSISVDSLALLVVYYFNKKDYKNVIKYAKKLQDKVLFILTNEKLMEIIQVKKDDIIFHFISSILFRGQVEFYISKFSDSTNTYLLGLTFLSKNSSYINSYLENTGLFINNIFQNYLFTDEFNEIEKFESSELFIFYRSKRLTERQLNLINSYIKISKDLKQITSIEKKQKSVSQSIKDFLEELSNHTTLSSLYKYRKKLMREYKTEYQSRRYLELKKHYLDLSNKNIEKVKESIEILSKSLKDNKKLLKSESKKKNDFNLGNKSFHDANIDSIRLIINFDKSSVSLLKAALKSTKRNSKKVSKSLKGLPKISFKLCIGWYFWKNILLTLEITIYVLLLGTLLKSFINNFIGGIIISFLIGVIIFYVKRYVIAPRLEKLFFTRLHRIIFLTLNEINLKYSFRYNILLKVIGTIENPDEILNIMNE